MEHHHGSLADDREDVGSSYVDSITYSSHRGNRSSIPLEAQHTLRDAFAANPYPTTRDIDAISVHTNLNTKIIRTWFRSYRLSEYSDAAHIPAPLHPLGPISVQSDIQFNSSWVDSQAESVADSGFFSNQSTETSSHSHINPSNYSASSFSDPVGTEPAALHVFSEQTQPGPLLNISTQINPWFPGSRLDQSDYFFNPTYDLVGNGQPLHSVAEYDRSSHNPSEHSESVSLSEYQQPFPVSSEAIGSSCTVAKSQGNVTTCDSCGAQFTGRYRRGNCARHVRQQHSGNLVQPSLDCVCRVCKKRFNRQDARRKHEWKKHQLQDSKPYPRRHTASLECDSSHVGTHDTGSDQRTPTCTFTILEEPTANRHYKLPTQPQRAHDTFAAVKKELDDDLYDVYCEVFLARCARIVEKLGNSQSDLYDNFTRGLHDLSMQLLPEEHSSWDLNPKEEEHLIGTQTTTELDGDNSTGTRQSRGKAPASRRSSKASSKLNPCAGRPCRKSGADPIVAIGKLFDDPNYQELDCPIYKWHLMHASEGMVSPCNGCGKPYMNGVRQHLLPSYSQQHQGKITFIQRCKTCAEDFVDQNLWDLGRHGTGTCHGRSQPQGASLICWARLYLKIYPEETRIPSPYRNDMRLLPDNLVTLLRDDLHLPQAMPYNSGQVPAVSHPSFSNPNMRHHPLEPLDMVGSEQTATLDTLISQASALLARFLAQEYTEAAHEPIVIEDVEAHYQRRLHELRQSLFVQPNQAQQPSPQHLVNQTPSSPAVLHHTQALIIGGAADFTTPTYQPNPFVGMVQVPDSDAETLPSSQEYHNNDAAFGFPSFPASSQTDYDFGSSTYADQVQSTRTKFFTPAESSDCPSSPRTQGLWLSPYEVACGPRMLQPADPPHNHGQWLLPYEEALLDMPGSSYMPQLLADQKANAQMMSEIESMMETSPSESQYAMSSYESEHTKALSDIDKSHCQ